MKNRFAHALPLLLLLPALPAAGQDAGEDPAPDDAYIETVDVNVVNVEVYVTDKAGERVLGLGRDDIELRVDRKSLPITYFYAVEGGEVRRSSELDRPPEPQEPDRELVREPTRRARGSAEVPEEQRLHLVIYVDNFNIDPLHRNRLFSHVRTFLNSRLRPADRVMLVSYDRPLRQRHPFTSDPQRVAEALFELETVTGHGARASDERREILDAIYEEANPDPREAVISRANVYAQAIFNDLQFTIDALKEIVEGLAGLPGRKAILYLSDGLAMRAGEDVFYAMRERWEDSAFLAMAHRFDASRRFREVTAQANAHRVSFYTVDAAGLRMYTYNDASNSSPTGGVAIDESHFANVQSPLQFMAEETGGLAIINTNRFLPKLAQVADDFGTYYSLGFTPAVTDNRYRQIEVRVKGRKGLRVRHRDGYRDKPVARRMSDTTLAALHHGYQQNALAVELDFGAGERQSKDHYLVPVEVTIPIANLSFLPGPETHRGRLRLWVAARDPEGDASTVQELPVPIDIPAAEIERARGHLYHHRFTLLMRRGRQLLAVGVRDEIGGETSFVVKGTEVGA